MAPLLADLLGSDWRDLDGWIAERAGRSISAIFEADGEARFRELEREAMATALALPPMVISPGGGWAAQPGNLDLARATADTILLEVTPEVAAARLEGSGDRPLLGSDLVGRLGELARDRSWAHARADHRIDADRPAAAVAASVAQLARAKLGW